MSTANPNEGRTLESIWEILEFLFTKFWEAFKDLGWIK